MKDRARKPRHRSNEVCDRCGWDDTEICERTGWCISCCDAECDHNYDDEEFQ